ncbi:MAG: GAF domain-containing sensor histidine kinase [Microcoleus sp. T3-bin5]|nr:GAF domain-containing sensor histidine kinase [Microcoleus sp. T3-bin5]
MMSDSLPTQSNQSITELVRSLGLTAYSCQPLIAQGKLFGTLSFGSRSRIQFTASETKLFQALCDQIAIALERSELMASLQQQTKELMQVNRLKDEFLAALSHELRTPLNPILGWTTMLRTQRLAPEKIAHALETIERNARAQNQLIEDLLDVSRIISGKLRLNVRPVALLSVIEAAIDSVRPAADAKNIRIQSVLDPAAGPVSGDPDRLQQVFWNLLSNAVKFTSGQPSPLIEISCKASAGTDIFSIKDNGVGFNPDLGDPFGVFKRLHRQDEYKGTGIGLAIAKKIVEKHNGLISAVSKESNGAEFQIFLRMLQETV